MAQCKLDLSHPKFRIIGNASDADLQSGLSTLQSKVAKDHTLSGFWPQPMPKYPDYQNKIWQWDFSPEGDRSSTRKGWRLYAYIPDPAAAEPIHAIAFVCWDKKNAPKGDYVKYLAGILKQFLATTIEIVMEDDQFIDRKNGAGQTVSTCDRCWDQVIISDDHDEIEVHKAAHRQNCVGHPPD